VDTTSKKRKAKYGVAPKSMIHGGPACALCGEETPAVASQQGGGESGDGRCWGKEFLISSISGMASARTGLHDAAVASSKRNSAGMLWRRGRTGVAYGSA
jgi:hypothetical protein